MNILPRAIYYISPLTSVMSLLKLCLGIDLKRGKKVLEFEQKFAKEMSQDLAVTTSHARYALFHILNALELKEGSEVLMTSINLPDMVNMIRLSGNKEKYIDYQEKSTTIDLDKLEQALTSNIKVFFYTHLYGHASNVDQISELCKRKNIIFIQDCTQSVGCKINNKAITNYADVSFYSLCDLKVIHTHRGGIITSNDQELITTITKQQKTLETKPKKKYFLKFILEDLVFSFVLMPIVFRLFVFPILKLMSSSNESSFFDKLIKGEGVSIFGTVILENLFGEEGNVKRDSIPSEMTYRFTNLQAKIGLKRLKTFKKIDDKRINIVSTFYETLSAEAKAQCLDWNQIDNHVFWKFPVYSKDPISFRAYLLKNNIDAAPTNLPCIPDETIFTTDQDLTNTIHMRKQTVCLPLYHYLSKQAAIKMAKIVNEYFEIKDNRI